MWLEYTARSPQLPWVKWIEAIRARGTGLMRVPYAGIRTTLARLKPAALLATNKFMSSPPFLNEDDFAGIVRHAPLIAIDLVLKDPEQNVLVGLRTNEPAKGFYFVPGGIIRKNETIENAFERILLAETGCRAALSDATFIGVFEHFYDTSRIGDCGTHYVVLAYELKFDRRPVIRLDSQHSDIRWMSCNDLLSASEIHQNTKAYFQAAGSQRRVR